jgi:hypothetical protein
MAEIPGQPNLHLWLAKTNCGSSLSEYPIFFQPVITPSMFCAHLSSLIGTCYIRSNTKGCAQARLCVRARACACVYASTYTHVCITNILHSGL